MPAGKEILIYNMTEDDTFRVLSRPCFEEMRELYRDWWLNNKTNTSLRISFMKQHKWTWLEFVLVAKKRGEEVFLYR
jgi:hypothetical protein